jgi:hypothetical protein
MRRDATRGMVAGINFQPGENPHEVASTDLWIRCHALRGSSDAATERQLGNRRPAPYLFLGSAGSHCQRLVPDRHEHRLPRHLSVLRVQLVLDLTRRAGGPTRDLPYARYFSFSIYGTINGQAGIPIAALHDVSIAPDRGSHNPFLPGASRVGANRSYTVTISGNPDPGAGQKQPNTLYAGTAGATGPQQVQLIFRVYLPNLGVDWSGGELPTWDYEQADGMTSTGTAACAALGTGWNRSRPGDPRRQI